MYNKKTLFLKNLNVKLVIQYIYKKKKLIRKKTQNIEILSYKNIFLNFRLFKNKEMNTDKTPKIRVLIRKRPLNKKQQSKNQTDIITIQNNQTVLVRQQKLKVDLTPYTDQYRFNFDGAFDQFATNQQIYITSVRPLVDCAFDGAKVSCFAYGQTGSGKTHTMLGNGTENKGLYLLASIDIFKQLNNFPDIQVWISFYQIYCGKLYDLLNQKNILFARQDAKNNVNIVGLSETKLQSAEHLMQIIQYGTGIRVTSQNGTNNDSSRSHAILQISLKKKNKLHGKISFIDLAGSQRAADHADQLQKQTRIDGAQINKSLLALKQCIRALDQNKNHTPFRGSKLTMVLKDSFTGYCRTVMIGNISPNSSSSQNTLNTLKYADRVKQLKKPNKQSFLQMQKIDQLQKQLMLPRNINKKTNPIVMKNISNNNNNINQSQDNFFKQFRENINNSNIIEYNGNGNSNKHNFYKNGNYGQQNGGNHGVKQFNLNNNNQINNNLNVQRNGNNHRKYSPMAQQQQYGNYPHKDSIISNPSNRTSNQHKNSPPRNNPYYNRSSSQQNHSPYSKPSLIQQCQPREPTPHTFTQKDLITISQQHDSYVQLILQQQQSLLKHHEEHINSIIELTKQQMSIKSQADKIGSRIQDYLQNLSRVLDNKLQSIFTLKQRIQRIRTHLQQSKNLEQKYLIYSKSLNLNQQNQQEQGNIMLLDDDYQNNDRLFIN